MERTTLYTKEGQPVTVKRQKKSWFGRIEKSLTKALILCFATVLLFTVIMIATYWAIGSVPDVLVQCFFTLFGTEVISCLLIQVFKERNKGKKEKKNMEEGAE